MPKPGHARIALAMCALLITIAGFIPPAHASEDGDARMAAIKAHLGDVIIPDARLEFEKAGPRLNYEELPGGQALVYAAYYYAISTGDFAVSYADLLDNGFWPYDIYDAQCRDEYLYEFAEEPSLYSYRFMETGILGYSEIQFSNELMKDTASAEWIFHARAQILNNFYHEYFEFNQDDLPAAVGKLNPVAPFWNLDELVNPDGSQVGQVTECRVFLYIGEYRSEYRSEYRFSSRDEREADDPLNGLMVKCLQDDHWQPLDTPRSYCTVSTNSGYDSQYRENTRNPQSYAETAQPSAEPAEPKIGVVPPAQPAPDGARRPGAVASA